MRPNSPTMMRAAVVAIGASAVAARGCGGGDARSAENEADDGAASDRQHTTRQTAVLRLRAARG